MLPGYQMLYGAFQYHSRLHEKYGKGVQYYEILEETNRFSLDNRSEYGCPSDRVYRAAGCGKCLPDL